jgi:Uma2 family endonuclease
MITELNQLDFNKKYTYADYVLWQFQERVELLKGHLFPTAAPNVAHQQISSNLHGIIWSFLRKHPCNLFTAPFDVRLPLPANKVTATKIDTVIQPDLCVICDDEKLDKQGCIGAPDLIIEILSPGNSKREMRDKFELYQEAGVLEYWVVDPERKSVFVYRMNKKTKKFVAQLPVFTDEDTLDSSVFEGLEIILEEVFPKE